LSGKGCRDDYGEEQRDLAHIQTFVVAGLPAGKLSGIKPDSRINKKSPAVKTKTPA
jgi:hypothetical protein